MWLTIGVPVLVLLGLVTARVAYYLVWRRHWDRRPAQRRNTEPTQVIVIDTSGAARPPRQSP